MYRVFTNRGIQDPSRSADQRPFHGLWSELVNARSLAWRFFVRDTAARYRQSILGLIWAIFFPLLSIAVLLLLSGAGIINVVGLEVQYPIFIVVGVWFWGLFALTLSASTNSLVNAGPVVTKIWFSRPAVILAAAGLGLAEFLIRLPVVLLVMFFYSADIAPIRFGLAIASLLPLFLLAIALGLFFSVGAAIVRDISFVVPAALGGWLLITPVFYEFSPGSTLELLNRFNPAAHFITFSRSLMLGGTLNHRAYWICTGMVAVLLPLGWRFFHVAQKRIAERV